MAACLDHEVRRLGFPVDVDALELTAERSVARENARDPLEYR